MRIWFTTAILVVSIFNVLCSVNLTGQQAPHFSQSVWQQSLINPAAVGAKPWLELSGIVRTQWIGIEGAPITQGFSVDLPIPIFNTGIGLAIVNDQLGAFRNTEVKMAASYSLTKKKKLLRVGAQVGFSRQALDGTQLVTPEGVYEGTISHEDDLLSVGSTNQISPNVSVGLYYQTNYWESGFYVNGLLSSKSALGFNGENILEESTVYNFYVNRSFDLGINWQIRPALWAMTDQINLQTQIGVLISNQNVLQGGIFLRGYNNNSLDALIAMLAYDVVNTVKSKLRVAYAYDFPLSELSSITQQTHELSLSYRISSLFLGKRSKISYNPRFL